MFEKFLNDIATELAMKIAPKAVKVVAEFTGESLARIHFNKHLEDIRESEEKLDESKKYAAKITADVNLSNTPIDISKALKKDWVYYVETIYQYYAFCKQVHGELFIDVLLSYIDVYNVFYNCDVLKVRNIDESHIILQEYGLWMETFEDVLKNKVQSDKESLLYFNMLINNSVIMDYLKTPSTSNYEKVKNHIKWGLK